jgi:triosephosphate isomerase
MFPVFCVGETQQERESGRALDVVADQIRPLLSAGLDLSGIVIAYEPVWAIGTGLSATRSDIEEMHATVRDVLRQTDAVVLYGGSVSPESAEDVFSAEGVSGALVGGASLDADKFAAIVAAWERK